MLKRTFALLMAVGVAALFGLLSPGAAVAASDVPPDPAMRTVLPAADIGAAASPKCSATYSHGKIRYQVCIRYNCDSASCWVRGYFGLINTATGPRNVNWWLFATYADAPDGNGRVSLAAGEQKTTFAPLPGWHGPCDVWFREGLEINYDGTKSPRIYVEEFLPCV